MRCLPCTTWRVPQLLSKLIGQSGYSSRMMLVDTVWCCCKAGIKAQCGFTRIPKHLQVYRSDKNLSFTSVHVVDEPHVITCSTRGLWRICDRQWIVHIILHKHKSFVQRDTRLKGQRSVLSVAFMFSYTHHGRQFDPTPPPTPKTATYEIVAFSRNEVIVLMCICGCD